MTFSDFTLSDIKSRFNIGNKVVDLFEGNQIRSIPPSEFLNQQIKEANELPIKSEKARSELIITPILLELRRINNKFFTIYSGDVLVADKELGLQGECDFILAKETGSFSINIPIITVVEAKRQDIELGINQCAAQLVGAKIFNENSGVHLEKIYGCVTTADDWKFMAIENDLLQIDNQTYYKSDISKILGIFQLVIDYYKMVLISK